jgi:hypothetical protein
MVGAATAKRPAAMGLAATLALFDWPAANIAAGTRAPTRKWAIVTLNDAIWSAPIFLTP